MKLTPMERETKKVLLVQCRSSMCALWLCIHESDILCPDNHFVACSDQLSQHNFVFCPLNFPKLLAMVKHELHS
jgi:hypothetical protein